MNWDNQHSLALPLLLISDVLGLFEQGILDRGAIQFLFELGFIPSSTVDSRGLLTTTGITDKNAAAVTTTSRNRVQVAPSVDTDCASEVFVESSEQQIEVSVPSKRATAVENNELAISSPSNVLHNTTSAVPGVTTLHSKETLRSLEATSIRRKLSQHESMRQNKTTNSKSSMKNVNGETSSPVDSTKENDEKPWDVEHFPLSMSRYQREFKELTLLNSGAFGQVYRALRELDGCEYAIKKITFDATGYSNESIQRVIREVQCLAAVNNHPNIVRYYTSWWEPTWMTGSIGSSSRGSESKINNDYHNGKGHSDRNRPKQPGNNLLQIGRAHV